MSYKIIVSVICIIFIVALIGSNLKSGSVIEKFEADNKGMHNSEDEEIHENIIIINGDKINYTSGSIHSISELDIDGTISRNIETTQLSLLYLSKWFYDLKNINLSSIFKVNNIKNNPILLKTHNFNVKIIYDEKPYIQVENTENNEQYKLKRIVIKEGEYYSYSISITPSLISFKITDNPDTQIEESAILKVNNNNIDRLYLGDGFEGNPCINPYIFRKQEPKRIEPFKINIQKQEVLKIFMEETFNGVHRIKWRYNKDNTNDYYVIIQKNINKDDMILNLVVPVIYNNNYIYELNKSDLKFNETIITLRCYKDGVLSKPSNNLIITK